MKPANREKFLQLIESNVAAGLLRGQELFVESLEEDLQKDDVLSQIQLEGVFDYLLTDYARRNH